MANLVESFHVAGAESHSDSEIIQPIANGYGAGAGSAYAAGNQETVHPLGVDSRGADKASNAKPKSSSPDIRISVDAKGQSKGGKSDPNAHSPKTAEMRRRQSRYGLMAGMKAAVVYNFEESHSKKDQKGDAFFYDPSSADLPSHTANNNLLKVFLVGLFIWWPTASFPHWATWVAPTVAIIGLKLFLLFPSSFPCIGRWRPPHWKSFIHILGLQSDAVHHRLPRWIGELVFWPILFLTILNFLVYLVFYYEAPGISRRTFNEYTELQQDLEWSKANPAEFMAHYNLGHSIIPLAGAIMILIICSRLKLSTATKKRLQEEQADLESLDPRMSKVMKFIRKKGFDAVHRASIDNIYSPHLWIGLIICFLNAFILFIFSPDVIKAGYKTAPGLSALYTLSCALVIWPAFFIFSCAMEEIASFFIEAASWMDSLSHTPFDFCSTHDFHLWVALRRFYLYSLLPVHYRRAGPGFAVSFIIVIVVVTALVWLFVTNGVKIVRQTGPQTAFAVSFLLAFYLMKCLLCATAIWNAQSKHIDLLVQAQIQLKIRVAAAQQQQWLLEHSTGSAPAPASQGGASGAAFRSLMGAQTQTLMAAATHNAAASSGIDSAKGSQRDLHSVSHKETGVSHLPSSAMPLPVEIQMIVDEKLCEAVEKYENFLLLHDPAPELVGLPIKPTLLRVIAAYLVSAAGIVVTKFLTTGA